jgi:Zn-dependent peptidase ImmA (M78 family)
MAKTAKKAAREILKQFGSAFPVDVRAIVEAHNVRLNTSPLEDLVLGWLLLEDGKAIIRVNKNLPPDRQRFSIAHSLGHFVLHQDRPKLKLFVETAAPVKESSRFMTGSKRQEHMADVFASELLMPEGELRKEIGRRQVSPTDVKAVSRLATKFGVSKQVLTMRLMNLGLIRV